MKTSADKTALQQLLELHRAGQLTTADYADALMLLLRAQTPDPIKRAFFVAAAVAIAPAAFEVGDDSLIPVNAKALDELCQSAHGAAQLRFADIWTDALEFRPRVADARALFTRLEDAVRMVRGQIANRKEQR
ncbi:MAG: hypothetical protein WAN59_10805 [Candidatus Baltobacteraceae bacterium]